MNESLFGPGEIPRTPRPAPNADPLTRRASEVAKATMGDGIIEPGTARGNYFGFTADKFSGWLWLKDGRVMVSFIECIQPGQGHFSALVKHLFSLGYTVAVSTPFPQMKAILRRWGWTQSYEYCSEMHDDVEVWSAPIDKDEQP